MKTYLFAFAVLFCGLWLASCDDKTNDIIDDIEKEDSTEDENDINNNNQNPTIFSPAEISDEDFSAFQDFSQDFAWDFFEGVKRTASANNCISSPYSAYYLLSMIANGAAGDTQSLILNTITHGEHSIDVVNSYNYKLSRQLSEIDEYVNFSNANSLWTRDYISVLPGFASVMSDCYAAEQNLIESSSFQSDFNHWCHEKTNGNIPSMNVGDVSYINLLIANAIYFKAPWKNGFKFTSTKSATFINETGPRSKADYMETTTQTDVYIGENLRILRLPLGYKSYGLYFIMTSKNEENTTDALNYVLEESWRSLLSKMDKKFVKYSIPKFRVDTEIILTEILIEMGMAPALSGAADYSNMTSQNIGFNEVRQKSMFLINEKGGEGSSVSTGGWASAPEPGDMENPISFKVNRPFLFVVEESTTKALIFIGSISNL